MKFDELKKYMWIFVLAVLIIAVYKTFDNIGIIFVAIGKFLSLFTPVVVAFGIAFLMSPMCQRAENFYGGRKTKFLKKHKRGMGVLTGYLIVIAVIAAVFWLVVPQLVTNIKEFVVQVPTLVGKAVNYINSFGFVTIRRSEILKSLTFEKLFYNFDFSNVNQYAASVAGVSGRLFKMLLSVIISIYILTDKDSFKRIAVRISHLYINERTRGFISKYFKMACDFVYKYVYCQFIDAAIVFVLAFIALLILGSKYALVLAFMVGLFNVIPYFGAAIAVACTVLVTIVTSTFANGIIALVVLVVLQQVDANLIQPRLVRQVLSVKPFWVLCAILVGGDLFGFVGILLAVPFVAFLKVVVSDFLSWQEQNKLQRQSEKSQL